MANYSEQLANAIAAMSKNVGGALTWTAATAVERQRPVDEILDVRASFVAGYPERTEQVCKVRSVE